MTTVEEILESARKLPDQEQAWLAEELLRNLADTMQSVGDHEYHQAWAAEIERRLEAADRGDFAAGDWRDVLDRIRKSGTTGRLP